MAKPTINGRIEYEIASLVATGLPLSSAARIAGISPYTVTDWYVQGAKPNAKPHWARFRESVDHARLEHRRQVQFRLEELRGRLD